MGTSRTTPRTAPGTPPRPRWSAPFRLLDAVVAHPPGTALLLALVSAGVTLVHLVPAARPAAPLVLLLCGLFGVLAVPLGTRLHRPSASAAWYLIGTALALFLTGSLLRPWSSAQAGALPLLADAATLTGYLALGSGLVRLTRAHGGLRREVLCDTLVATVAGALAVVSHLVVPAMDVPGRPPAVALLFGAYPIIDVVFLALLLDLLLTGARRTSHQLVAVSTGAMLVGDLGYAILGASGQLSFPAVLNAPFAVAFVLTGVAALHPAQRRAEPVPVAGDTTGPPHAWSARRLTLLGVSLAVLLTTVAVPAPDPELHRWAVSGALAAVFALLLVRAVSAVNGHARVRAVLLHRAGHDPLTDLPNRSGTAALLANALAAPRGPGAGVWVLYCDLDGFKRVNDGWGHAAGDELIRCTASRLRAAVGEGTAVCRIAGDEFVLVTTGTRAHAEAVADVVLAAVVVPVRVGATEIVLTASLGIAAADDCAESALRDADAAMYRAKASGRNRWAVFDASMRHDISEDVEFERDLRRAVADGGLDVAYQPIVEMGTGRPVGVEALLRWEHPRLGPVSPVRFVPVLEDTGLVTRVGLDVLGTALADLARWRADGVVDGAFVMSVNVSPRQLRDPGFPAAVGDLLQAAGVPGACLLLELTESSMLEGDEETLHVLHGLRALGAGLAVDDFGTGYSALSYLRRLPVTRVKVDRSFVAGICTDPSDAALVRAVEALSRALGLAVTAEGVETEEQRLALHALGIGHGQGWLWSRAEPAARCAEVLTALGRRSSPVPAPA